MISVANMDVAGIAGRFAQFAKELVESQSARQSEFVVHDITRTTALLDYLVNYINAITGPDQPLDLPKSHPTMHPVLEFPTDEILHGIENLLLMDLLCRFKAAWVEVTGSQSKDRASGLLSHDIERLLAVIENCRLFIKLGEVTPDLPENPGDVPIVS